MVRFLTAALRPVYKLYVAVLRYFIVILIVTKVRNRPDAPHDWRVHGFVV